MRTTFDLPDPLFQKVKIRAVQQGVKLKDLVAHYLEAGLCSQPAVPGAAAHPPRSPLPVFRAPTGKKIPALTNAQLQTILDEEDTAQ